MADLQVLSPQERQKALELLAADAVGPSDGPALAALGRIREYERRYEAAAYDTGVSYGPVMTAPSAAIFQLCSTNSVENDR